VHDTTSPRVPSRPLSELDAARAWMMERGDCTGKVGVIGFCMGGGYALMLVAGRSSVRRQGAFPLRLKRLLRRRSRASTSIHVLRAAPTCGMLPTHSRSTSRLPARVSSGSTDPKSPPGPTSTITFTPGGTQRGWRDHAITAAGRHSPRRARYRASCAGVSWISGGDPWTCSS